MNRLTKRKVSFSCYNELNRLAFSRPPTISMDTQDNASYVLLR
jgi:hypothetical protein